MCKPIEPVLITAEVKEEAQKWINYWRKDENYTAEKGVCNAQIHIFKCFNLKLDSESQAANFR